MSCWTSLSWRPAVRRRLASASAMDFCVWLLYSASCAGGMRGVIWGGAGLGAGASDGAGAGAAGRALGSTGLGAGVAGGELSVPALLEGGVAGAGLAPVAEPPGAVGAGFELSAGSGAAGGGAAWAVV